MRNLCFCIVVLICMLTATQSQSQSGKGAINGVVRDQAGGILQGARSPLTLRENSP